MKFTQRFPSGFVLAIGIVFAGISFVYAQNPPTIRQISLSQGAPGTLIELMGQFDTDVEYQVKFGVGEVLVPGYIQQDRLITMVPVLSNEQQVEVSVRAVGADRWEPAPESFRVLALPAEPRMTAQELKEELVAVGQAFEEIRPLLTSLLIGPPPAWNPIPADSALFNNEMSNLNAVWSIIGSRIDSLSPEDVVLLGELLHNSGALDILRSLAQTSSIVWELMNTEMFLSHYVYFHLDRLSFLIDKGNVVLDLATFVACVWLGGQPVAVVLSGTSTVSTLTKDVIDIVIPTDLDSIRTEEQTLQLSVGDTKNLVFVGKFAAQGRIISGAVDGLIGYGWQRIRRWITHTGVTQNTGDFILNSVRSMLAEADLNMVTASKLANLRFRETDVPLDMSLYQRKANSWFNILEQVGVNLNPRQSFAPVKVESTAVARYNTISAKLTGLIPGTTRLQIQGYKFIDEWTVVGPFYWNFEVLGAPE